MADTYGDTAPYGELPYKQDRGDDQERHLKIMLQQWPIKQMLEDDDE